jgi:HAMP domain-containing protein
MMTMPRLVALVALIFCFVAGYFVADLWSRRDTSPLAQICARVDYVNGLQENLKDGTSEEVQAELKALAERCRMALRNRAEEND